MLPQETEIELLYLRRKHEQKISDCRARRKEEGRKGGREGGGRGGGERMPGIIFPIETCLFFISNVDGFTMLLLVLSALATLSAPLVDPPWDWQPLAAQFAEHCLRVPDVPGYFPNSPTGDWNASAPRGAPTSWTNNSRLLHLAVPPGPAPRTGWPVLITVDIHPVGSFTTPKTECDSELPQSFLKPPRPKQPKVQPY